MLCGYEKKDMPGENLARVNSPFNHLLYPISTQFGKVPRVRFSREEIGRL